MSGCRYCRRRDKAMRGEKTWPFDIQTCWDLTANGDVVTTISVVETVGQHVIAWMHDRAISTIVTTINLIFALMSCDLNIFSHHICSDRSQSKEKKKRKNKLTPAMMLMMIIINDIFTKLMCQLCYGVNRKQKKNRINSRETVLYIVPFHRDMSLWPRFGEKQQQPNII